MIVSRTSTKQLKKKELKLFKYTVYKLGIIVKCDPDRF